MIDWPSLVANSAPEQAENPAFGPLFPQKVGTDCGGVGTDLTSQYIENKEVLNSVPTVPTVPTTFERARVREDGKHNPTSFKEPGGDGAEGQPAPHKEACESSCKTCAHLCRPGLSDGLCGGGRDDLPPAFTKGHPLHRPPADGGKNCPAWRLHWSY